MLYFNYRIFWYLNILLRHLYFYLYIYIYIYIYIYLIRIFFNNNINNINNYNNRNNIILINKHVNRYILR